MVDLSAHGRLVAHAVSNLDSVMVMQLARGEVNGAAAAEGAAYQGAGEFLLASATASNTLNDTRRRACDPGSYGIISVMLQYNNQVYPQQPIDLTVGTTGGDAQSYAELYHEYLKALDLAIDTGYGAAIPYDVFRTAMPFIMLRPNSTAANRLSSASDLVLITRTAAGDNATFTAGRQVALIWFQLKVFQIAPTGKITFVNS